MKKINRREAIRQSAMVTGGLIAIPSLIGGLEGCTTTPELLWQPQYLGVNEASMLDSICRSLIPSSDLPGSAEAQLPSFIEKMFFECYTSRTEEFRNGLTSFSEVVKQATGKDFEELDEVSRIQYLQKLNDEEDEFFLSLKQFAVMGYCTSEPGATRVLQYVAIPTRYEGCISLEQAGGRTWAT